MSHFYKKIKGFTLVEMMVSIAIISVILGVVLMNQSDYTDRASLYQNADEIAITFSQAQVYGTGVREYQPGLFNAAYGVSFNITSSGLNPGSDISYLFYATRWTPRVFTGNWVSCTGVDSVCIQKFDITRGNRVNDICSITTSGHDCGGRGRVDIAFTRPSTEAIISFFDTSGNYQAPGSEIGARIILVSPKGATSTISVYKSGQISVQ